MSVTGTMLPPTGGNSPPQILPQFLWTAAATLVVVSGGTAIGWTSSALLVLQASENSTALYSQTSVHITPEQGSWVGSLLPVGALFGALPAGSLAASLGPKKVSHLLGVPLVLSWLMKVFAANVWLVYLARLVAGAALGASCASVPTYIGEIAHPSIRGSLCSCFQLMLVVGILFVYALGAFLSYRMVNVACAIVPAIFLAVYYLAPESPAYLLRKGNRTEAENSFRKLRGRHYNFSSELRDLQSADGGTASSSFLKAAAKAPAPRALIISFGLMVFQQLSGINIVIFYVTLIFKDANTSIAPTTAAILVGLVQVVATSGSVFLIEKAGRKILLLVSGGVMSLCLIALGVYFRMKDGGQDVSSMAMVPLASVIIYIAVFAIGFGPIPWLMAGEVLPNDVKGIGTSIAVALNWGLAFFVTKIFQDLLDLIGAAVTYWILAAICAASIPFILFTIIETKGRSYPEIQRMLCERYSLSLK